MHLKTAKIKEKKKKLRKSLKNMVHLDIQKQKRNNFFTQNNIQKVNINV